jgi:hypothetical protein
LAAACPAFAPPQTASAADQGEFLGGQGKVTLDGRESDGYHRDGCKQGEQGCREHSKGDKWMYRWCVEAKG